MHVAWSYCKAAGFVAKRKTNQLKIFKKKESAGTKKFKINKEERYCRVPRLSDTCYSAKGTKGKW